MDLSEAVIVKSSRLKSVVWNDFDRYQKGDTCVAVCMHCKKRLSGSSSSGTSHLRNHLIRCKRRVNNNNAITTIPQLVSAREKKRDTTVTLANHSDEPPPPLSLVNIKFEHDQARDDMVNVFDQRRSRFDLARMIILHGYPLSMVDHIRFKVFVKNLQPLFDLVTFDEVESVCREIYEEKRQKVCEALDKLPGKISVSVDKWLSVEETEYLSLTAHYIDEDWQLKKKLLSFNAIDNSQTEDELSQVIITSLMKWDIDRKLFSMTFDNGSASDSVALRIRDRLSQNRFLFCDGRLFDIRCAADALSQMVEDTMEAEREIIDKVRESIRYVKFSQATHEKFMAVARELGVSSEKCLHIDNALETNPISTYSMLESALEHKPAFSLMQEHAFPSETEWERVSVIAGYIKFFLEFKNVFLGNKQPTANIYFAEICDVHLQLMEWCKSPNQRLSALATALKAKFDKYSEKCSLGLAVAAILDPRFKMKLVEYYFPQIYSNDAGRRIHEVSSVVRALYNEHSLGSPLDQGLAWQVSGNGNGADRLTGFDRYIHETSQSEGTKSDFDKYLEEPLFPRNADFSILNWWKVHSPRYPVLSMMARNVLAVPMSRVGSGSAAFDAGGRVLDPCRSALAPATVEALVCSQDWIQSELES